MTSINDLQSIISLRVEDFYTQQNNSLPSTIISHPVTSALYLVPEQEVIIINDVKLLVRISVEIAVNEVIVY